MSSFDDMQTVWQATPDAPPHLGPAQRADLFDEADRFDRKIRWRDRLEYAGVAVTVPVAVWMGVGAPLVVQIGAALMVVGAAVAVAELWRAQRRVPPPAADLPAVDALRRSLARVDVQIGLLTTVHRWYLAPLAVGPLVILVGRLVEKWISLPADVSLLEAVSVPAFGLLVLAGLAGFYFWVYRINQRAVRNRLIPLRDRFVALLGDLDDDV